MGRDLNDLLRMSVAGMKEIFLAGNEPASSGVIEALEADPRQGVRALGRKLREKQRQNRAENGRLRRLLEYERELWDAGYMFIAGVDEAGMAPLAGPVVAAAVILPRNYRLTGLDDSKRILDHAKREVMAERIKTDAVAWAAGWAEVEEIDRLNIYHAGLLAMRRAVEGLTGASGNVRPDFVLVDARTIPECVAPQRGIIRGDQLSASIAAASIIAKTARDAYMCELDRRYPGYGLAGHKGYPTPEHLRAIRELGVLPVHRRSFRPVREALGMEPAQPRLFG
jgi:ribonuclease HII